MIHSNSDFMISSDVERRSICVHPAPLAAKVRPLQTPSPRPDQDQDQDQDQSKTKTKTKAKTKTKTKAK